MHTHTHTQARSQAQAERRQFLPPPPTGSPPVIALGSSKPRGHVTPAQETAPQKNTGSLKLPRLPARQPASEPATSRARGRGRVSPQGGQRPPLTAPLERRGSAFKGRPQLARSAGWSIRGGPGPRTSGGRPGWGSGQGKGPALSPARQGRSPPPPGGGGGQGTALRAVCRPRGAGTEGHCAPRNLAGKVYSDLPTYLHGCVNF